MIVTLKINEEFKFSFDEWFGHYDDFVEFKVWFIRKYNDSVVDFYKLCNSDDKPLNEVVLDGMEIYREFLRDEGC